ncbi:MAG: ABC transporter substrate-binding protein [Acidimicrobiia bacterium]|nr:ABC transporter substrate-binding protein [Acidimicrobiia bacterium]
MSVLPKMTRLWVVLAVIALITAACGSDTASTTTTDAGTTETTVATTTTLAATTTAAEAPPETVGDLSTCPNPLVIQTAWFPEPEYGPLFQLTGGEGAIDSESGVFSGPLAADPSITLEIRAGGQYSGFVPAAVQMYADDEVFLGLVPSDSQIAAQDGTPVIGVMAMMEKSPLGVMWDPDTYTFETWSDIGASNAIVTYFDTTLWPDYLVSSGQLSADQLDGSYDGSPSRFISEEGAIVQQAFASHEPWQYEHDLPDWGKPVDMLLVHDAGYEYYEQQLAIRADRLDDSRECLKAFVPLAQQAIVDFMNDPGPANAAILQAVTDLASYWVLSPDGVANAVQVMDELGIMANGANDTIGDFDLVRLQRFIDAVREIPGFNDPTMTAEDLATNEFIDMSIGR